MISQDEFIDATSLIPTVVAEVAVGETGNPLPPDQLAWFATHVDLRTRCLYTVDRQWRRELKGEPGRDFLYAFVHHWLKAFVMNPDRYMAQHPHSIFENK